jgi:hypothetical protein
LVEELMPVILVIIIMVAWMVILGPNIMKRRSTTVKGSISHFHRALRTLEHAAPEPIVAPAYRLRSVGEAGGAQQGAVYPDVSARPVLIAVGADQLPRPALAFLGDPRHDDPRHGDPRHGELRHGELRHGADEPGGAGTGTVVVAPAEAPHAVDDEPDARGLAGDPYARRLARRRRRDTLGILAVVFIATLMIGFVPGAGDAWIVSAISAVALAAYMALLVRLRRAAEEREQKLRYLRPGTARGVHTGTGGEAGMPPYMSGRYAHPSNQAAAAR